MQGVEAGTAADILPGHLPHHDFRIGINVEFPSFPLYGIQQGFHQGSVLGHIVVLVPDPLCDPDGAVRQTADHHPNTRRTRIPQAPAVHVSHQF